MVVVLIYITHTANYIKFLLVVVYELSDMGNSKDNHRGRGVLTDRDRLFLELTKEEREEEFSASARSKARRDIINRVRNATLDFTYLASLLDDELLNEVFAPERGVVGEVDGEELVGTQIRTAAPFVPHGVEFLLRAARADDRGDMNTLLGVETALNPFVDDIEKGIERWLSRNGVVGDVEVDVTIENKRTVDQFAEELAERDESLGLDYYSARAHLARGGYSEAEIEELVGDDPLEQPRD